MAEFTSDWVTNRISNWLKIIGHLQDKPNLSFLEIGSYEGRSACWWLENILTHHSSVLTCVDIWFNPDLEERFDKNIKPYFTKVRKIKQSSHQVLPQLHAYNERFDFIYIDGSHEAKDVICDAILALNLIKKNGIILFDDYLWKGERHHFPKEAIDSFLSMCDWCVEVIHRGYQLAVRKL